MEYDKLIRERYSCRNFNGKPVEKNKIDKILEAGRIAPTAKNLQAFKIYVTEDKAKIDSVTNYRYGAPLCMIICGDKENDFKKGNHSYSDIDASIIATHMMLEASNLEIDNIWVGLFDDNEVKEVFDISDNYIPVGMLMFGYSNDKHMSRLH